MGRRASLWAALLVLMLFARTAAAQLVEAAPVSSIVPLFPPGVPPLEAQVTLHVVVDAAGAVESAVEVLRMPREAPDAFARAAIDAVKAAHFSSSSRDGRPFRSRIEYVVVFHPPAAPAAATPATAVPVASPPVAPSPEKPASAAPEAAPAADEVLDVTVHGIGWSSPRGLGDIRVDRETLTASPRQHTSEMLSAAPGFFVDHEDGEGLGNDVYLRGFDLDNGSGIEMKLGEIPINVPLHIHGQGYADVNFIIPEVVDSIRVLEGPYDPRQGDSAIVGSALFDLAVPARGYRLKSSFGSFGQARVLGIAAPAEANDETFAAFAVRQTQGFGQSRASKSASVNAQYGVELNDADHVRVLATAYVAQSELPGVIRQDDVNAGRIGFYDAYPNFNAFFPAHCTMASCAQAAQGVFSAPRKGGARFAIAPWFMWTNFLSRQNYTGNLNSSNLQPNLASLGDLWELTNVETAAGTTARLHTAALRLGNFLEVVSEPGVSFRVGHSDQSKNLVNPANLTPWDYRASYGLNTLDLAGYRMGSWLPRPGRAPLEEAPRLGRSPGGLPRCLHRQQALWSRRSYPRRRLTGGTNECRRRGARASRDGGLRGPACDRSGGFRGNGVSVPQRDELDVVQLRDGPAGQAAAALRGRITVLSGHELRGGRSVHPWPGTIHVDPHGIPDRRRQRARLRGGLRWILDREGEHSSRNCRLFPSATEAVVPRVDRSVAAVSDLRHLGLQRLALRAERALLPLAHRRERHRRADEQRAQRPRLAPIPVHRARGRHVQRAGPSVR